MLGLVLLAFISLQAVPILSFHSYFSPSSHGQLRTKEATLLRGVKTYVAKDSPIDRAFIIIASALLKRIAPNTRNSTDVNLKTSYNDFVSITKNFLSLPPLEIKLLILGFLRSLVPTQVGDFFRSKYSSDAKTICEQSSQWMGFRLLTWLVGPTERILIDVTNKDGNSEQWLSGVKIKECRYLSESGCKAACLHICKDPTQTFFTQDMGLPLHMKPNFTDNSCEMLFGVMAPPKELDDAYSQACFVDCNIQQKKTALNKCS